MALTPSQQKAMQRKYYVYDPNVGSELGGTRVYTEGEGDDVKRYVLLAPEQARHWLELLAIGEKPFSEFDQETQVALDRMWGGRLRKKGEGEYDPKLRRIATKMPVR